MMGLPSGWVTDPAIGLKRKDQLKALGNGVVPLQVAAATAMWVRQTLGSVA
jgi:DNA (cytosine-5)-methyltransferase 1